ncbi:MAG: thioredoxin family protein [Candidatus Heimdallarchaeum endolithica]|uniref:Thioredoxin family protein n=1 Tax=Candidatus Heimdallarchaeum endolithica TaxID=2876572 RepID=A0A9Y1FPM1_9ARCH|nr:MAG: thioredoxin family protein [Candidatus Heimdallarchaeum endolithica]
MSEKKKIKVLGAGCKKCKKQLEYVQHALRKKNKENEYEIEYVTDPDKIAEEGIFLTPALIIGDKVISEGKIVSENKLEKML